MRTVLLHVTELSFIGGFIGSLGFEKQTKSRHLASTGVAWAKAQEPRTPLALHMRSRRDTRERRRVSDFGPGRACSPHLWAWVEPVDALCPPELCPLSNHGLL